MIDIVLATRNKGKVKEFEKLLKDFNVRLHLLTEFPDLKDVDETGTTFEENALLKARTIAAETGMLTIADDSGLEVDALSGRPGVYSARYAGEDATDKTNNEKLLSELKDVLPENRDARFVCDVALAMPNGKVIAVEGKCEGKISQSLKGDRGFGYDPLFYLPHFNCTMAEIPLEKKNEISHRAMAIKKLKEALPKFLKTC